LSQAAIRAPAAPWSARREAAPKENSAC
jgi:hypothetical protein